MITSSRGSDFTTKQEENPNDGMTSKASTSWSRLKDPRIVRVSRAFGGKDRHSKVCTVRGLRDRRVRLSVPTAIQLYDLQDRLGLNQPSKVVDWLINAAKHEIDQLPPLQMPPGSFGQFHYQPFVSTSQSDKEELKMRNTSSINSTGAFELSMSNYKENLMTKKDGGKQSDLEGNGCGYNPYSNIFFSRPNNPSSSLPSFLNNNVMPQSSFVRWDPNSDLSLSNFGHIAPDFHSFMPSGSQVLECPQATPTTTQSYFPPLVAPMGEFEPKQINFQMLGSGNSQNPPLSNPLYGMNHAMRPFQLIMTSPKPFSSLNSS